MEKTLTEMAAEITTAQAAHSSMTVEEMEAFLKKSFEALQEIKSLEENVSEAAPEQTEPIMSPKKSILKNKIICLECGKEYKILTNRHLEEHGINAKEYKKKYGFKPRQPLAAKSLSAARREIAQKHKLGEKLQAKRKAALETKKKKETKKPKPQKTVLRKASGQFAKKEA
jgi:predicted transcriptional regulator